MLDVEKKDLVDALVTRVIAANNEVGPSQFPIVGCLVELVELAPLMRVIARWHFWSRMLACGVI